MLEDVFLLSHLYRSRIDLVMEICILGLCYFTRFKYKINQFILIRDDIRK